MKLEAAEQAERKAKTEAINWYSQQVKNWKAEYEWYLQESAKWKAAFEEQEARLNKLI